MNNSRLICIRRRPFCVTGPRVMRLLIVSCLAALDRPIEFICRWKFAYSVAEFDWIFVWGVNRRRRPCRPGRRRDAKWRDAYRFSRRGRDSGVGVVGEEPALLYLAPALLVRTAGNLKIFQTQVPPVGLNLIRFDQASQSFLYFQILKKWRRFERKCSGVGGGVGGGGRGLMIQSSEPRTPAKSG